MTINSQVTDRTLHVERRIVRSVYAYLTIRDERDELQNINVSPEDFAREINEARIPGLTVTYEKPVEIPTEPGAYHDKDGDLWVVDRDGNWFGFTMGLCTDRRPGMDPPKQYAPFTRLIPESEADL